MGRSPCCDKAVVKRGSWSAQEDTLLRNYIQTYGTGGNWIALPRKAGLNRCGKSCRLRWLNYLRPDIKHGGFTQEEEFLIWSLYKTIGSRWSIIASKLPGRTDNEVKNYWNTKLKKKMLASGQLTTTNTTLQTSSRLTPLESKTKLEANNSKLKDDKNVNYSTSVSHMNLLENVELKEDTLGEDSVQLPRTWVDEILNMSESEIFDAEISINNSRLSSDRSMARADDHVLWMDMFSGQAVTGFQLEQKIREVASLLDVDSSSL